MHTPLPLIDQPFHDQGPQCLPTHPQALGQSVPVRVWVPDSLRVRSVCLRQGWDGEPRVVECEAKEADGCGRWYEAQLVAHNLLTRYRFVCVGEANSPVPYAWVTASGFHPHDVSDTQDFSLVMHEPAPSWVDDAAVYHIFPDRFARSRASAPITTVKNLPDWAVPREWDEPCARNGHVNGTELYGGNLAGIEERLEYIQDLGFTTVYLTPVFPAGSAHRYDASTFTHVDPLLGGDEALASLSAAVHARGMRLILDLTTNHTGSTHEWFHRARRDPGAPEREYYMFTEDPDSYVSWMDVPSLPKLNHAATRMREALYEGPHSVVAHWLAAPFHADGWRIDVANMTGRYGSQDLAHEVARTIRSTMGPEHWLVAEHGHDATRDLDGDGWHGTMNYVGFTRPLWSWLTAEHSDINWLGLPMGVPRLSTESVLTTLRTYNAEMPWPSRLHSQNHLCSHDTARIRTVVGDPHRHAGALGALIGLPGVPTLFAGDEFGLEGVNGEHSRTPMPWQAIDSGTLPAEQAQWRELTRSAFHTRARLEALRRGGLRFVHAGKDSMTWVRTHPTEPVLVHVARAAHRAVHLPIQALLAAPNSAEPAWSAGDVSCADVGQDITLTATTAGALAVPLAPLGSR